jgi:hypothetical protein
METGWHNEEVKMKPASALGVIDGQCKWSWWGEPWATRKTAAHGNEGQRKTMGTGGLPAIASVRGQKTP